MATHSSILTWRILWTEEPMDRGTWWAVVHRVTKSWTRLKLLSMHARMPIPHCLEYSSFVVSFESEKCESSNFVLFQDCFGYSCNAI